ncbi:MAG: hypothetical protein ACRDGE_11975 [Candidatus Limnocylindria bacterium]
MTRDNANWAKPVAVLDASDIPGAVNANVRGRRLSGVAAGFGQLWQKTFRVRLAGADVTPEEVVRVWKQRYSELWPKGNRMFLPEGGIAPGGVGIINASFPGAPTMATGVLVVYADETSFSFMTPLGHPFTGIITFSAERDGDTTVAQVHEFVRATDPLWEIGAMVLLGRKQNEIWVATLRNLARLFGAEAEVEQTIVCVDRRRQWRGARNIVYNAGIRSGLYAASAPLRWIRRLSRS